MADEDSKALVYVAVGALAAVGVGFLVWKYAMTDESRGRTLQALKDARRRTMETVKTVAGQAKETMADLSDQASEGATQVRATAARKAAEVTQRMRA